jgi:hypothetical protein
MSLKNIAIGLAVGLTLLALCLWLFWYFSWSMLPVPGVAVLGLAFLYSISEERRRHQFLRPFWRRSCTGKLWKRRFPQADAVQVREFLDLFIASFGFSRKRRLAFAPEDKVFDIYRGLYPSDYIPDAMELESLARAVKKRYRVDLVTTWRDDLTLGELFQKTCDTEPREPSAKSAISEQTSRSGKSPATDQNTSSGGTDKSGAAPRRV